MNLNSTVTSAALQASPCATACQLLLVLAADWDSTQGAARRFVRETDGAPWQPVGAQVPVSLGRHGLAWGRGRHARLPDGRPDKEEGDGRAPVGVFSISAIFGYAEAGSELARAAKLPYLPARPDLKCVDDPASGYYNCLVDQSAVQPDWQSCEEMLRADARYEIGAVVEHNAAPSISGAGSCIFLHVWEAPGKPTAGCTAMALADMREIALWLDAASSPCLVLLPQAVFEQVCLPWGLPGSL